VSLPITPAANQPAPEGGTRPASKYVPSKPTMSMGTSRAPIPGADQPVQFRGVTPLPESAQPGAARPAPVDGGGEVLESLTPDELARRTEWWADRMGRLARQTKESRRISSEAKAEAQRIQVEREALAAERTAVEAEKAKHETWRRNPAQLLRDWGHSPEGTLQLMLQGEKLTPEQAAVASLDERMAQREQQFEQRLTELQTGLDKKATDAEAQRQQEAATVQQQAEQVAVEEELAEIRSIIEADPKAYVLLSKRPQNSSYAVYGRLKETAEDFFKTNGHYPHLTTRRVEEAIADVEEQARKELAEFNEAMGIATPTQVQARPAPARPTSRLPSTLHQGVMPRGGQPVTEAPAGETYQQKVARVKNVIDQIRAAQRARGEQ